ncbi:SAM-dependent methyltransferase [Streptomyces sp. WMMC905]|uniref:SAM-dependent methyltransferase n=1 Tax=Streptomyces sp. WMMC905 TaxID=3404123 RepID=UPI003B952413
MTPQPDTTESVGRTYERFAEAGASDALGGNIHAGYWDDDPDVPVAEATDRLTDVVAARLAPGPDARLLDVGCGTGVPAVRIATTHRSRVTGIDASERQVAEASARARRSGVGDRISFRLADAGERLPFDDGHFDGAWAIESLLHLTDPGAALAEIHRVVRPDGRLVVADLCRRERSADDEAVWDGMLRMYEIATIATPEEHRERLAASGWRVSDLSEVGERVRPSYGHAAAAFRELADGLAPAARQEITAAARLMESFGRHPHAGYVLITAVRD